ncbi:DUF4348 domain-containing protein [Flavobacterium lacus]|uniref:Uncharacterized protein DUF4348 n=1 Tax=Flavobacterium lacus TaxID=1353778 RepID=A0A328WVA9_9FLAO|nr:DUF4348 domain-containing protein [Flavobacterium lacus]RAR48417.1 uncharacterized protein DUF4348 [Flavobacterium lacus]
MNIHKTYFYLILVLAFLGCKPEVEKVEVKKTTESRKQISGIKIPENVDGDFKTFLYYFSKDSIFQISRVNFPLKVMEVDQNNTFEQLEMIIQKNEYTKLDFEYPKDALTRETSRYTQNIKTKDNKSDVEIRGYDNGIDTDYFFEKENGKWILKSWDDNSN